MLSHSRKQVKQTKHFAILYLVFIVAFYYWSQRRNSVEQNAKSASETILKDFASILGQDSKGAGTTYYSISEDFSNIPAQELSHLNGKSVASKYHTSESGGELKHCPLGITINNIRSKLL